MVNLCFFIYFFFRLVFYLCSATMFLKVEVGLKLDFLVVECVGGS